MIDGVSRQLAYLKGAFERGKPSAHAYLFYGPRGAGKFAAAKRLVSSFPDVELMILDTQSTLVSKKAQRKEIPIEDIRELKRRLSLASRSNAWRVILINEAERLSREAADAFLKILEEPGPRTLFILISSAKDMLPPTVISRMVGIRFLAEKDGWVSFAEDPTFIQLRTFLREKKIHELLRISSEAHEDKLLRDKTLFYLTLILREELLVAVKTAELPDQELENLCRRIKLVEKTTLLLETTNVNPRLALDAVFLG